MTLLTNENASPKAGAHICGTGGSEQQTTFQNLYSENNRNWAVAQRARLLVPKSTLENVQLAYDPNAALTHRSAIGRISARKAIEQIRSGDSDPDEIYLALKEIINCDLPAANLAELRTFARLIQLSIQEVTA